MYAGRHVGVYSIRHSLQLDESFDKQENTMAEKWQA